MTNGLKGMKNLTKINIGIVISDGQRLKVTYTRDKILSVTLKEGCYLEENLKMTKISKARKEYVFDGQITSGKGFLFAMKITHKYDPKTVTISSSLFCHEKILQRQL